MKTRYFSLTGLALAAAFLTMPLIAAEKPVEGTIDPFLGEAKLEMQQLFIGGRLGPSTFATDTDDREMHHEETMDYADATDRNWKSMAFCRFPSV